jgi:putative FmdB family regulatory protein
VYEVWQQMSDKPLKKCRECSGKVQKLISRSAFHLKGSGWYATDYAGKSISPSPDKTAAGDGLDKAHSQKEKTSSKTQNTGGSKAEE